MHSDRETKLSSLSATFTSNTEAYTMDRHEAKLLDRLNDYYKTKKELEEIREDIEEILVLYNFEVKK